MKRFWLSESSWFNLAGACIFVTFGAVVTPSVGLHLVFAYKWGVLALAIPSAVGVCALARAIVLQRRRYTREDANSPMWRTK